MFHRNWGNFADPTLLPNASGAALPVAAFALEVGDQAYSISDGLTYTCTNVGTPGGADAVWSSGGGGSGGVVRTQERSYVTVGGASNQNTNIGLQAAGGSGASARTFDPTSAVYLERQLRNGGTTSAIANSTFSQRSSLVFAGTQRLRLRGIHGFGGTAIATGRYFAALINNAGQPFSGATQPSALANELVGIALDSGDANLQLIHNDGVGVCTKIDLGAAFARAANMVVQLDLDFRTPGEIDYTVTRLDAAGSVSGTLTTDIPAETTALAYSWEAVTDATGTVQALIDFLGMYATITV